MFTSAYRLWLAWACTALVATCALARGGGGCLQEGTPVDTPGGPVAVEKLSPGDPVWSWRDGRQIEAHVVALFKVQPSRYVELRAGAATLRLTPEHPVQVSPGVFVAAGELMDGRLVFVVNGNGTPTATPAHIGSAPADRPAYNLTVWPGGVFSAASVVVHNKGCFLPDTPVLRPDGSEVPIDRVHAGESVLAFRTDGTLVATTVRNVIVLEVDEYLEVQTDLAVFRVTADHPFYVGGGEFRTMAALRVGDAIMAYDHGRLGVQTIAGMRRVQAPTRVFNLQTDEPNTFFAGSAAVHNKGGGCFPAGTPIATPDGPTPIERLTVGSPILAVDDRGRIVVNSVEAIFIRRAPALTIRTDGGVVRVTADHPLQRGDGRWITAGELQPSELLRVVRDGERCVESIATVEPAGGEVEVFNLTVGPPHTFIAGGFVVHNKGGGFSGGGFHSYGHGYGSSQSSNDDSWVPVVLAGVLILAILIYHIVRHISAGSSGASFMGDRDGELDFVHSYEVVSAKAGQTNELLATLAERDPSMRPDQLVALGESTFRRLQECWQSREYEPMRPLLMPDLFEEQLRQVRAMVQRHEINRIDQLTVHSVDPVQVCYTTNPEHRHVTLLIWAQAKDYYVDDRNGKFLRGDEKPADFQEFWTFHWTGERWLLREIEQSRESTALRDRNRVEAAPDATAPPPVDPLGVPPASRLDVLLNALAAANLLWGRRAIDDRARGVYLKLLLARESGAEADFTGDDLAPTFQEQEREAAQQRQRAGESIEYRNLCVRNVVIASARDAQADRPARFVARITSHAQVVRNRGGAVASQDPYVRAFTEYATFALLDGRWKLQDLTAGMTPDSSP